MVLKETPYGVADILLPVKHRPGHCGGIKFSGAGLLPAISAQDVPAGLNAHKQITVQISPAVLYPRVSGARGHALRIIFRFLRYVLQYTMPPRPFFKRISHP